MSANCQAVGLSNDLKPGIVVHATWRGVELAVWRSTSGVLSAWKDRCPHRGMRLSHGFVRGETLNCIYHGWTYKTSGACVRIPAHPDLVPPAAIAVETFACQEKSGVVFVSGSGETGPLPDLEGLMPVRSISVDRAPAGILAIEGNLIEAGDGSLRGSVAIGGRQVDICLLIQPSGAGETRIHALAGQGADKVAVSRWLEGLRRRVEEQVAA